jgi:hypothetical protein
MIDPITTAAPRGTRCTECLCCDAEIIVEVNGTRAKLCGACDDGTHPAFAMKKPTPPATPLQVTVCPADKPPSEATTTAITSMATLAAKIVTRKPAPAKAPAPAPLKKEEPVDAPKSTITEQQIALIRQALDESPAKIARRLNIVPHLVYYYVGKFKKERGGAPAAGKAKTPKAPKPAKSTQLVKAAPKRVHAVPVTRPAPTPVVSQLIEVRLQVTEATLDAWWHQMGTGDKAAIFERNFVVVSAPSSVRLLGTVS